MLSFPLKIGQNKKLIRKYCRSQRQKQLVRGELAGISQSIVSNILHSEFYRNSKHIMLFYPLEDEINLLELLKNENKFFYFPKCSGKNLLVCPNSSEFVKNKYSIFEPLTEPINNLDILDIVFTPALCADKDFYRIGYGGGYYDRFFLNQKLKALKVIPLSEKFICEKLPREQNDIRCDVIVSESGLYQRVE